MKTDIVLAGVGGQGILSIDYHPLIFPSKSQRNQPGGASGNLKLIDYQ